MSTPQPQSHRASLDLGFREDELSPVRGIAVPAVAGAILFAAISAGLAWQALRDAAPLRLRPFNTWLAVTGGDGGVAAIIEAVGSPGVASMWRLTFWLAMFWLAATAGIATRLGLRNERDQGWSEMTWICGLTILLVAMIAIAQSGGGFAALDWHASFFFFPSTDQDPPTVLTLLLARTATFAVACVGVAYVFHDLGYYLREVIGEADEATPSWASRLAPKPPSREKTFRAQAERARAREEEHARAYEKEQTRRAEEARAATERDAAGAKERAALATLHLAPGASNRDVKRAWKKLMQSAHPDHGGSNAAAARLNEARDFLLGKAR